MHRGLAFHTYLRLFAADFDDKPDSASPYVHFVLNVFKQPVATYCKPWSMIIHSPKIINTVRSIPARDSPVNAEMLRIKPKPALKDSFADQA